MNNFFLKRFIKDFRRYLYGSSKDDRFHHWLNVPDWSGYIAFLRENNKLDSEKPFGGLWIDKCSTNQSWGLVKKSWEYHMKIFLVRHLGSEEAVAKVQKDLLKALNLLENKGFLLKSEFIFDQSDLSLLLKRAGLSLTCGELRISLMVDEDE